MLWVHVRIATMRQLLTSAHNICFKEKVWKLFLSNSSYILSKIMNYLYILQGFKSQALAVTCDPEHKFELAVQLGDLKTAYTIAKELEV